MAKVILTVRDAQSWYDSVSSTIYRMFGDVPADDRVVAEARRTVPGLDVFTAFHRQMIWDGFFDSRFADRAHAIRVYEEHNAAVPRRDPPHRLLTVAPDAGGPAVFVPRRRGARRAVSAPERPGAVLGQGERPISESRR
jgi:hypothetical protein